jgi:hypothetical protein
MARTRWTYKPPHGFAHLAIGWNTLTDPEQLVLRREAWSLAANPHLMQFLAATECPLIAQPFDPPRSTCWPTPAGSLPSSTTKASSPDVRRARTRRLVCVTTGARSEKGPDWVTRHFAPS